MPPVIEVLNGIHIIPPINLLSEPIHNSHPLIPRKELKKQPWTRRRDLSVRFCLEICRPAARCPFQRCDRFDKRGEGCGGWPGGYTYSPILKDISKVLKPLLPLYLAMIIALLLVTYLPQISLFLPRLFGF